MPSRKQQSPSPTPCSESTSDPDSPPQDINPYTVLSIPSTSSASEIRSAYRRLALLNHPDKTIPQGISPEIATKRFQDLAFAYAVLSDENRRARYDATGSTSETIDDEDIFNWSEFYKTQFAETITTERIEALRKEYRFSDEEKEHVLRAYETSKGDMDLIFEKVMFGDVLEDEERFREIIKEGIEKGEVKGFKKFTDVKGKELERQKEKRVRNAKKEAQEAEELAKELGLDGQLKKKGKESKEGGEDMLKAMIMQRQKDRSGTFMANLEAKYATPTSGKKGTKRKSEVFEEPPEELFAKNAKLGKAKKESNDEDGPKTKKARKAKA